MIEIDLDAGGVRALNQRLHALRADGNETAFRITNPMGAHSVAVGIELPIEVAIDGHVGFYCGGMNREASITIYGHAGPGVAENMMSGRVHVTGNCSQGAGASGRGGMLIVDGDASSRCGISMKGISIVVKGSVGHMSAFMGQTGNLVVCGDCGRDLGDSLYEARIYVRGQVASLGSDCVEKTMTPHHRAKLAHLLAEAGVDLDPDEFRRYGSARRLYNFQVDHAAAY
jgi:methylamine---glutamate N-methyltransferase subunit B